MLLRSLLHAALIAAAAAHTAVAQDDTDADALAGMSYEEVQQAYLAGDHATARAGLVPIAEAGDVSAQYRLGFMMARGEGGPADWEGAVRWLEAAVAQDHAEAGMLLARVYLSGNPEEPHYARAAELLEVEAAAGNAEAQHLLAQLLRAGRGIEADPARAVALLDAAARAGQLPSMMALAQMHSRGEGTELDPAQAARWLFEAAEKGYGPAQMSLYQSYAEGRGFPQDLEKAKEWLQMAADSGDVSALHVLGTNYLLGESGYAADPIRGVGLLIRAAEQGHRGAQTNLGYAYFNGVGVPQDPAKAFEWYLKAADQGLSRAAVVVGQLYAEGVGTEVDTDKAALYLRYADSRGSDPAASILGQLVVSGALDPAVDEESAGRWVAQAADQGAEGATDWLAARAQEGDMLAHYFLGALYFDSENVPQDTEQAVRHMRIAAEADVVPAQFLMGQFYAQGFGVEQNLVQAHVWSNIAASNGSDPAAEKRDAYAALMTPEQIAEAQDRARARLRRTD